MWTYIANFIEHLNAPWWVDTILWFVLIIAAFAVAAICIAIPLVAAMWFAGWVYKGTMFCIRKIFDLPAAINDAIRAKLHRRRNPIEAKVYPKSNGPKYKGLDPKFLNESAEVTPRKNFLIAEAYRDGTGLLAAFPDWGIGDRAESGLAALSDRTADMLQKQFQKERALLLAAGRSAEVMEDEEMDFHRWKVIVLTQLVEKAMSEAILTKDPRFFPTTAEAIRR
jgi:hypothetical protein